MEQKLLKPCPFCGSDRINYSVKTTGRWERKYHVAMYCKDCNCYGARILITPKENNRSDIEKNELYRKLAEEAWNTRMPVFRVTGILEKELTQLNNEFSEAKKTYNQKLMDEIQLKIDDVTYLKNLVKDLS